MIRRVAREPYGAQAVPSIISFLDDPSLLGASFAGPSWNRWRAVLRAAFALPLFEGDLVLFREVAGNRAPPIQRVRELVCAVGRGGGKDSVAAAIAVFIALTSDFSKLRPGERATVMLLAVDRGQARIAYRYVRALLEETSLLAPMIKRVEADRVELTNGAEVVIQANNARSPRGRTIAAAIYDEAAFWLGEDYANPDVEIDNAISPGLMRFPGSMKIIISSVHRRSGLLHQKWSRHFGKDDPDVLVVHGSSVQFNPTLDRAEIDRQLELDPEKAAAEYLSLWRDDLVSFLDRALIDAAVDKGIQSRAPQKGVRYKAFADPSGGRGDSFTLAIGHAEGSSLIVDCLVERRAPFDSDVVINEISGTIRAYGLTTVYGDSYGADLVVSAFRRHGISYQSLRLNDGAVQTAKLNRSQIYLNAISLFTAGRARLLDNPRLVFQLVSLERRASRTSGHDTVDHPAQGHDDLANACCGVLVALGGGRNVEVTRDFVNSVRARLQRGVPHGLPTVQSGKMPQPLNIPRAASFVPPGMEGFFDGSRR